MGHSNIQSKQQYIDAIRVLDKVKGTWQGIGPSFAPMLLLTDAQCKALVTAGVVPSNDKVVRARGKKASSEKTNP